MLNEMSTISFVVIWTIHRTQFFAEFFAIQQISEDGWSDMQEGSCVINAALLPQCRVGAVR
jgi:hypothetical protein